MSSAEPVVATLRTRPLSELRENPRNSERRLRPLGPITHKDVQRFEAKVSKSEGCWIWQGWTDKDGYGGFWLNGRTVRAHRVAWAMRHGELPSGLEVLHSCDVPGCVRNDEPGHLFVGTTADNMADKTRKGRQAKGERCGMALHPECALRAERNPAAKLTAGQAAEIRRRHRSGESGAALGREFGISGTQVRNIATGRHWRDL